MSYIMMGLGWILKWCSIITQNYGVAIILFTVLIKLVLLPLTVKQQRSMMRTQKLQPLLMELQQKYGNDKEKLNQETMKLYQKYQVNPMSGCLPMLIQLPILMMLYWVVKKPVVYIMGFGGDEVWRIISAVLEWSEGNPENLKIFIDAMGLDLSKYNNDAMQALSVLTENSYKNFGMYEIQVARFLQTHPEVMASQWITDIGKNFITINYDFIGLDLSRTPNLGAFFGMFMGRVDNIDTQTVLLWIIPLLSGLSSYVTSKISQAQSGQKPQTNDNGEEAPNPMKGMMTFMPIMSAWFAFTLPAVIGLYWIISNILAMVQQVVLNKLLNSGITDEQIEGEIINAKKNRKKRKK